MSVLKSLVILTSLAAAQVVITACGQHTSQLSTTKDSSTDSLFLFKAGDNARSFFFEKLSERYQLAAQNGVQYETLDARDPRLYPPGQPWQPPTTADQVIAIKMANGGYNITALVLNRPGYLSLMEFPTGNMIIEVKYSVEYIGYSSRFVGLYGSVSRYTSGYGWNYLYYLRGYGNAVNPAYFDQAIAEFLTQASEYVTPF